MKMFPEANWPEWEIESEIGSGAFGKVYSIIRKEENGIVYRDALKVVNIPKSRSEVEELYASGMDEPSITEYYRSQAWHVFNEIHTLNQVGGTTNIVNCKDHKMVPQENGIGYRIFIRMELLTPLTQYQTRVQMDTEKVVRMGIDLARALEVCERHQIIHRDIKPANIFVSDNGDFKLGDFGIARNMDARTVGTVAGTYTYMAPEIYGNRPYDLTADIYSLGVVLYQYLNGGRLPFVPTDKPMILPQDIEQSFLRRMRGEPVPDIGGIPAEVSMAVCQALEFDPRRRFRNASEFRAALEEALAGPSTAPAIPRFCRTCGTRLNPNARFCPKCGTPILLDVITEDTVVLAPPGEDRKKKFLTLLLSIAGGLLALLVLTVVITGIIKNREKDTPTYTEDDSTGGKTQSRTKDEAEEDTEESEKHAAKTEAPEETPLPDETEKASSSESEAPKPPETEKEPEPETTTTEAPPETTKSEAPVSLETQVLGTWIGDLQSVIFLKENGSCVYREPTNTDNIRLRRGVQCRWSIYGTRLYIDDAGGYDLYADLGNPVSSMRIMSDNTSWNVETFRMLNEGESLPAVDEKDCYLLPSYRRKLSDADLDGLSKEEIKLARNEIFARHHRKFKDEAIRSYFEGKSWYSGTIESSVFDANMDSYLNENEIYNYKFITDYENRHK